MGRLSFTIASTPDRDEPVAELWQDDVMWGELARQPAGGLALAIYPSPSGRPWSFDLAEFDALIRQASQRLRELYGAGA